MAELFPRGDLFVNPLDELEKEVDLYCGPHYAIGGGWSTELPEGVPPGEHDRPQCPTDMLQLGDQLLPERDPRCQPGAIRGIQPNEGRDFTRWLFHSAPHRPYDFNLGDGLDETLADPDRALRLWNGEEIPRDSLIVGRHADEDLAYPGVSLGDGLGALVHDGTLHRFPITDQPEVEFWYGDYPFEAAPIVVTGRGCLVPLTSPLGCLMALFVFAALAVLAAALVFDGGGSNDVDEPNGVDVPGGAEIGNVGITGSTSASTTSSEQPVSSTSASTTSSQQPVSSTSASTTTSQQPVSSSSSSTSSQPLTPKSKSGSVPVTCPVAGFIQFFLTVNIDVGAQNVNSSTGGSCGPGFAESVQVSEGPGSVTATWTVTNDGAAGGNSATFSLTVNWLF